MDSCDVLIVGGGPSGSSCAWKLRQSGLTVALMDKATFPRDKVCAGWVTPNVIAALQLDREDYKRDRVLQPIRGFRVEWMGGNAVTLSYGQTVSYGIRRCEFDHYLLTRAEVPMQLHEPLKTLERDGDRWIANKRLQAAVVVGAGGHFCPVARMLRGSQPKNNTNVVAAQEVEFEIPPDARDAIDADGEIPELYFCRDLKGYGWCVRKGEFLNVGLGRIDSGGLTSHLESFCDDLRQAGRIPWPLPARFRGHAYRVYQGTPPPLCDDRVLLIGDSAGLAYPQSGEGIRPAVESGLLAAETILNANGDYRLQNLHPYRERLTATLGEPRTSAVTDRLPGWCSRFLASRLLGNRWFVRNVVLDRWFLHRDE